MLNDALVDMSAIRLEEIPRAFRAAAGILARINPGLRRNVLRKNLHSSLMLGGFKGQESFLLSSSSSKEASPAQQICDSAAGNKVKSWTRPSCRCDARSPDG